MTFSSFPAPLSRIPGALRCAAVLWLCIGTAGAQMFYPDDPLEREPPPFPVVTAEHREVSEILDLIENTFKVVGERHSREGVVPALGTNTLGEVLDGPWFENRRQRSGQSGGELPAGPRTDSPPSGNAPWQVLTVKRFGSLPGILVLDGRKNLYLLRFDPIDHLEMATGAAMISSRIFHALGYHVPENYIAYFERSQLEASRSGNDITSLGRFRRLTEGDIDRFLESVAVDPDRGFRALATRIPTSWRKLLGPFQFHGVRSDDPNDIYRHEHRRDLRGLYVFASWINFAGIRAANTMDVLVEGGPVPHIRHYWMDFSATLGSAGTNPKPVEAGNEAFLDGRAALRNTLGAGIYTPDWMRVRRPSLRAVSGFGFEAFEPGEWQPLHPLASFENLLPDDGFWAARKVMRFSDEDIRTLVGAARYTEPGAAAWVATSLIERRDRIGKFHFSRVLPLDDFTVRGGRLDFRDLEVEYGFAGSRSYRVQWSEFDNFRKEHRLLSPAAEGFLLPSQVRRLRQGRYAAARIEGEGARAVTVFLRQEKNGLRVVGVDRDWPGKSTVSTETEYPAELLRFADLESFQQELIEETVRETSRAGAGGITPREYFRSFSVSERTTFDAVTRALMESELTDARGNSLGRAIDLVEGIERVAGQEPGKRRDQQFRIYARLQSDALEKLEGSRQFFRDQENTRYHIGYPICYRQGGNLPSLQFSISRDGRQADIDVDYRASGWPVALFNGHLSTANSDVRAGDNVKRHNRRWAGLIDWWRGQAGTEPPRKEAPAERTVSASNETERTESPAKPATH